MGVNRIAWLGVLWVATACSASRKESGRFASANATSTTNDDSELWEPDAAVPTWWRLHAKLQVSAGLLTHLGSALTVEILDQDGGVLCTEDRRVDAVDNISDRPDPTVLTWWNVSVGESTGGCDAVSLPNPLPASVFLGIGDVHPEIEAVAGWVESLPPAGTATLNGAYAQIDESQDDIWVYGLGGDAAAWSGTAGPASVTPIHDGLWTLRGIYSFPLP